MNNKQKKDLQKQQRNVCKPNSDWKILPLSQRSSSAE